MAIALRGTPTTGSAINGGDITLSLPTGLQENDVVLVGAVSNTAFTAGTSSSGWTLIGSTLSPSIGLYRKVMGVSPDTDIVLPGNAGAANSSSAIAIAFSGVDTTTPEDGVAITAATNTSANPDPAAITPNTTGAVAVIYAAGFQIDVTGTAAPAGYSNFTQVSSNDSNDTTSYLAWKGGLTGGVSEDPGAFTGVSSTLWGAYTVVLRPAGTGLTYSFNADPGSYSQSGQATTFLIGYAAVATPAGAYDLTGQTATTTPVRLLVADPNTYAVTGQDANLIRFAAGSYFMVAEVGTIQINGTAATLRSGHLMVAASEVYSHVSSPLTLTHNIAMTAASGSYAMAGTDAALTKLELGSPKTSFILAIPQQGHFGQHHT